MTNRNNQIIFTILSGILLLAGGVLTLNAQTTEFSGKWNTVTSKGKKIVLVLKSTDRRSVVSGSYAINALSRAGYQTERSTEAFAFIKVSAVSVEPPVQNISSILGRVTGNVLNFKWTEDGGQGSGRFTMSADGRSFQGVFSKTNNPDDGSGGTWNGTRAPVFAGVWQMSGGPYPGTQMLFQDGGSQVVGHLFAGNPAQGVIKDGSVDGNTLRFTIYRPDPRKPMMPHLPDIPLGNGELTMNADGKSFAGTVLGVATTGTRVGR